MVPFAPLVVENRVTHVVLAESLICLVFGLASNSMAYELAVGILILVDMKVVC